MKPRACSQCGDWYNPKFHGTETLCGKCHLKEITSKPSDSAAHQKVKNETSDPASQQKQTTHRPEPRMERGGSEFRGVCNKCGLWLEGAEIYDRERGWVYAWAHVNYDKTRSKYCLVA